MACSGGPPPGPPPPTDPTISYRLVGTRLQCDGAVSEFHDPFPVTYVNPYDGKTMVNDIATEGCYWRCASGTLVLVEANLNKSPPAISVFNRCG
jgi:hypothetical protein